MKLKYLYSVIILISFTASCQNKKPTAMSPEEKAQQALEGYNRPSEIWPTNKDKSGDYYYRVNMGSIKGNLAVNAGSYFTTGKEEVHFGPRDLGKDWGDGTGSFVMNDEYHPIPKTLFAQWFSISENKFYAGSFDMPTAVIQKYLDKMWLSYGSNEMGAEAYKHERFIDIIVGVAPKGIVIVWVSGGLQQIEIGRYQAKETQMEWENFSALNGMGSGSTKENYLSYYKNQLPVPYGKVDKYREKFIWKPEVESNNKIEITLYDLSMYNGEMERIYYEYSLGDNLFYERAVPKEVGFNWQFDKKTFFLFEIKFKEDDIYEAFHEICKDKNTKAKLILKIDDKGKMEKIALSNGNHEYVLNPESVKIYGNERNLDNNDLPLKRN